MREDLDAIIKLEIEHVFGRRIVSSRDCNQLCDEIYKKTHCQLNPNTLRRFFGLVKAEYPASISTLNILSKYCGFRSIEDVYSIKQVRYNEEEEFVQQRSVLNYLVSLFGEVPLESAHHDTLVALVKQTISFLNQNPGLIEKFYSMIAKTINGQAFYFEQFVYIDKLNSYYGNGLRYYLNEKPTEEAFVFAHSLLVFRYWLTGEVDKLNKHYQEISNRITHQFPPFIIGRYYAAELYHAKEAGMPLDKIAVDIFKFYAVLKSSHVGGRSLLVFELVVGEALILTGQYEEGLYYLSHASKRTGGAEYSFPELQQTILLFEVISLFKQGRSQAAIEKFVLIKPYEFHFLRKQYMITLYLSLATKIKRRIARFEEQLNSPITELGFLKLKEII